MSASLLSSPCRRHQSWLLLAGLSASLASAHSAQAADNGVQIDCPELTGEQAAEIESRVRASLLTTDVEATVAITCRASSADVRVQRAPESVVVSTPTSPAGFRDDVLRAVEQALDELMRRQARAKETSAHDTPAEPAASAGTTPEPTPLPVPAEPEARPSPAPAPPRSAPSPAPNERAWTEVFGALVGESWPDRAALGGALGVARSTGGLWFALRASVLRPSTAGTFSAVEAQLAAELGVQPDFAAGVRLALALGPSVLFVQPQRDLATNTGTAKASPFAAVHVSRPIWLGRLALLPDVGVRLFAVERGVSVDGEEQLLLNGFVPHLSLGVAYRFD